MIELKKLNKIYKSKKGTDTKALDDISLNFDGRGLTFIVGPSGSGKSSLLNVIGALDAVDSGDIICDGYNVSKMSLKELEKYRNTYVGFVFQDFNLLEEYNVYDNILLSLELQGKNSSNKVDVVMQSLGIESLKKRRINELSGGQKQRVAIARGLVKNSKLILADEPTGNLDSKTSIEIMELLKDISETCEVIVVTHDEALAESYGDRIIKISDGKIVSDNYKEKKKVKNNIELVQSRLSKKNTLKLALASMRNNLFRTIMTTVLAGIALALLIILTNFYLSDRDSVELYVTNHNNVHIFDIDILRCVKDRSLTCRSSYIDDSDLKNISAKTTLKENQIYRLYDNDRELGFELGKLDIDKNNYYYFDSEFLIVDVKDDGLYQNIIYGTKPTSALEVVISEYLSEIFMKYGVLKDDNTLYKPNSKEALVNDKVKLKFGSNSVIVSGIIKDKTDLFDDIKHDGKLPDEYYVKEFYKEYIKKEEYPNRGKEYVYTSSFVDDVGLKNTDNLPYALFYLKKYGIPISNNITNFKVLDKEISYYSKDGKKIVDHLEDNQVIMSYPLFKELYDGDLKKDFYDFAYENRKLSYTDAYEQFLIKSSESIASMFYDDPLIYNRSDDDVTENIAIIGYTLDDASYVSPTFLSKYRNQDKTIIGVRFNADNDEDKLNLIHSFKNFKDYRSNAFNDGANYLAKYDYQEIAYDTYETIKYTRMFATFLIAIFSIFLYLFFANFINNSIKSNKRRVGSLMLLGASSKDVKAIFLFELMMLIESSFILSLALSFAGSYLINLGASKEVLINNAYIIMNVLAYVGIIVCLIVVTGMLLIGAMSRIIKMQPIDAYNER